MELNAGHDTQAGRGSDEAIRVAIVEDHPLMCQGIRRALHSHDDIEVVGEAHSGAEAVELLTRLNPDVVLMDYGLPDADGVSVMRDIRRRGCDANVVVLTCHTDEHRVREAIDGGAVGFLTKGSVDVDSLADAVRNAGSGRSAVSSDALGSLIRAVRNEDVASPDRLTEREREVWSLVSTGMSNRQIASQLCLSERTVKFHVGNLLRKTGTRSRAEATSLAYREGFMDRQE